MSVKQHLYTGIMEDFKAKILSGELKPNDKLPSESEIAEQYNVSRITSKRAMEELYRAGLIYRLRGSGSYVAKWSAAKNGNGSASKAIYGLSIPFDSSLGRSVDLVRGASDYLRKKGCLLSIQISDFDANKEREIIRGFADHGVQGLILYPVFDRLNLDILYEMTLDGVPIVTVDKYIDGLPIRSVVTDNLSGGHTAVQHLIDRGHRSIGFISDLSLSDSVTVRDRYFGYCKALKDNDITLNDSLCAVGFGSEITAHIPDAADILRFKKPFSPEVCEYLKIILEGMMGGREPVTAVFALNDYIAIMLIKSALEAGIKVPQELSVIGYDNIELAQHAEVPLTTIEQDFYGMGYEAARTLVRQTTGELSAKADMITALPVKVVERQSVADIRELSQGADRRAAER